MNFDFTNAMSVCMNRLAIATYRHIHMFILLVELHSSLLVFIVPTSRRLYVHGKPTL